MQKHFNFAHTIVPQQQEQSSQNLLDLFKIGGKDINISKHKKKQEEEESDSDQTVKQKKIKKQKKEHKHKQKKDHKHKQKKDKDKKQKKNKKHKQRSASQQSGRFINQPIQLYRAQQKIDLYQKYSKVLQAKSVDQMLTHKFELNIKLGQGCLNVDVIRFPEYRLFQYGPMDKEIPRYQRFIYESILGLQKSRQATRIIKQLNQIINQKNINPNQDQISNNRYFHFQGYQNVGLQTLVNQKVSIISSSLLKFTQNPSVSQEENMLKMTKEINRQINQNPKNINIWLQFIRLQDSFSLSVGSLKNKSAVLDRKISILQKSLHFNKFDEKLGIIYLSLLFQKQYEHKQLTKKSLQFVKANPSSIPLWKFYFTLSIEQFNIFSHPYIRTIFQQINKQFKGIIDKTKSAIQIWKIRKASLQILKNMLHIYKLQGYGELSTGIIVALIQFNLFMPEQAVNATRIEQKLSLFQKYWDNYEIYKLGQTLKNNCWSNTIPYSQSQTQFIGKYSTNTKPKQRNPIMKQLVQSQRIWRTTNAKHDQSIIEKYPESFVLFEDIDFALMLYRDNESLTILIDILADHLEIPPLFSANNIYTQFSFKIVQKQLKNMIKNNNYKSQYLGYRKQSFWWHKFWNPAHTQLLISQQNMAKMQYFRRILNAAKTKMPMHKSAINQYLAFIICCINLSPKMQQLLQTSENASRQYLSDIMKDEPLNIGVWCIYIQSTYIKNGQQQECIDCFLQLFETVKLIIPNPQSQTKINIQILYWLSEFARLHSINISHFIMKMFKKLSFGETDQTINRSDTLSSFDCLLIEQYLSNQINKLVQNDQDQKVNQIDRYKAVLFLLSYLEEFPFSSLTTKKEIISLFLVQSLKKHDSSNQQLFVLHILISYRLLSHQQIISNDLLKIIPHLALIQYWISQFQKPLLLFQSSFQTLPCKNLVIWIISCIFLSRKSIDHNHCYQYLISHAKKICFEDSLTDQHSQYIILLNQILIYDVNHNHSKFIAYSLHHIPYSKTLYLLNLLCSENQNERHKISMLIHQKSIRILDPTILSN